MRKHAIFMIGLFFVLVLAFASSTPAKRWVYLGNAHVDKTEDHKTIHVGGSEPFHTIQLRVSGGAVDFERVVVHYADGTKEELSIHERVRSGGKTHEVELPGDHRTLDSVEIWYAKEKFDQRPEVRLYAAR